MSLGLSSAQQAVQKGTEVQIELIPLRVFGFWIARYPTCLSAEPGAIPALGWETHSFQTMILNFSRYLTQQGNKI